MLSADIVAGVNACVIIGHKCAATASCENSVAAMTNNAAKIREDRDMDISLRVMLI